MLSFMLSAKYFIASQNGKNSQFSRLNASMIMIVDTFGSTFKNKNQDCFCFHSLK